MPDEPFNRFGGSDARDASRTTSRDDGWCSEPACAEPPDNDARGSMPAAVGSAIALSASTTVVAGRLRCSMAAPGTLAVVEVAPKS